MEEEMDQMQPPADEVPGEDFNLGIDSTFTMEEEDLVIKQEPQDIPPDIMPELMVPELMDNESGMFNEAALDDPIDEDLAEHYPDENDDLMQRAVSPPSYDDIDDQKIEELRLYYKDIYDLKDVSVKIDNNCDKLWETFKLIKEILPAEESVPNSSIKSKPKIPDSSVSPPQQTIETEMIKNSYPNYRFSVKNRRKLYHCLNCNLEYKNKEKFTEHAIGVHGVYIIPKRMYKMSENRKRKLEKETAKLQTPAMPHIHGVHFSKRPKVMNVIPEHVPINLPVMENIEPTQPQNIKAAKTARLSVNGSQNIEQSKLKVDSQPKEKIKCILCKRITADIIAHLKNFHKVGCVHPIAAQCERIVESTVPIDTNSSASYITENALENDGLSTITEQINTEVINITGKVQSNENDEEMKVNSVLPIKRMKKKRRNATNWTMTKKRKIEFASKIVRNSNSTDSAKVIKDPFKCDVCHGEYKTIKTFRYHKKLHMIRGETRENFDPSKCRFKNSPFKTTKSSVPPAVVNQNLLLQKRESPKLQAPITNYITVEDKSVSSIQKSKDPIVPSDQNEDTDYHNDPEQTTCGICGKVSRDYHTMYLHKQKCKGIKDSDSGIVFSIKIKKNKDSYEVVPSNLTQDENYKEPRSSKDSDISSNDSGMASVSSNCNNKKSDTTDPLKMDRNTHSILRIQVAEDDEEVDIEDEESNDSIINGDLTPSFPENDSETTKKTTILEKNKTSVQTNNRSSRYSNRRSNVPSLSSLCKQALEKIRQSEVQTATYKCQTCSKFFNNKTELMEHGVETEHNVKTVCSCGKEFKNLKYLNIHVRRYHPDSTKCNYCKTKFDRIEKYIEHQCEVTEEKIYIEPILQTNCLQCKTLLDIEEPFDKHMKTHSVDTTVFYQCFKCDLRFDNIDMRKAHFSKVHGHALCRVCGKLLHLDHLSSHEAYHEGLGHPCHLCKKTFTQKNLLKKHIQFTHDPGVNDIVKCMACSKTMKLKYLKKHMSEHLHTEVCKKCNKCYRNDDRKNLELHIAVEHSKNYPLLKCDTCSLTFITDKDFEEHCQKGSCQTNEIDAPAALSNVKIEPVTD